MANEFVVIDRTDSLKKGFRVDDGQLTWTTSTRPSSSEPIVEDKTVAGTYWQIYIDDGQIGFEETVTAQDDQVRVQDLTTTDIWELQVFDGQLFIENSGITLPTGIMGGGLIRRRRR